jgi:hypothetical protein
MLFRQEVKWLFAFSLWRDSPEFDERAITYLIKLILEKGLNLGSNDVCQGNRKKGGERIMKCKLGSGLVLFAVLMALSLGLAFAEQEIAEDTGADENATLNNTSINESMNLTNETMMNETLENLTISNETMQE